MAFPVTLNGRTYTLTDFEGTNYVDGLPDAFEDFVTHAGDIYNSTSTTSNSIGTGSKTFTVEANKPYQAGTPLRIADAAAPSTNFLDTVVTSYSGTTLVVNSIGYGGSGTKTSWTVNIGGAKTIDGTLGVSQGGTGATTAAAARTNLDTYSKTEADSRFLNVSGEASDVTMTGNVTIGDAGTDTLTINAATTTTANISFGDDDEAIFGAGSDLKIYHNSSNGKSYIEESGSGNLVIRGSDIDILSGNGEPAITAAQDGAVTLYYDNAAKLATVTGGVDIEGNLTLETSTATAHGQSTQLLTASGNGYYQDLRVSANAYDFRYGPSAWSSSYSALQIGSTGSVVFNGAGLDADFRVESDSQTHMLFVDAGNDRVGISDSAPTNALSVAWSSAGHGTGLDLRNEQTGGYGGSVSWYSTRSDDSSQVQAAQIRTFGDENWSSAATASSVMQFRVVKDSNFYEQLRLSGTNVVINEDSRDTDFRVESDGNANMLVVDAGANQVVVGSAATVSNHALRVAGSVGGFGGDVADTASGSSRTLDIPISDLGGGRGTYMVSYFSYGNGGAQQNGFTAMISVMTSPDRAAGSAIWERYTTVNSLTYSGSNVRIVFTANGNYTHEGGKISLLKLA